MTWEINFALKRNKFMFISKQVLKLRVLTPLTPTVVNMQETETEKVFATVTIVT